jgi:hypothetical protein
MLRAGDLLRIRPLGSEDDWCVCRVSLVSENGASVALSVLAGGLRIAGGMLFGGIAMSVDDEKGIATEAGSGTELEVEIKE